MTAIENLHEAMVEELRDLLHAEKQLTKALPKLAKAADDRELEEAFEHHLRQTEQHIERVKTSLEELGKSARAKQCDAMEGIIREGENLIKTDTRNGAGDVLLIAAAQKAEHYEIASYGTVIAWAKVMGHNRIADTLHQTLEEERATDEKLTAIARRLNQVACEMCGV